MWKRALLFVSLAVALVACATPEPGASREVRSAPLEVTVVTPRKGVRTVAIDTDVTATFSVDLDMTSIEGNFTLADAGGAGVAGEVAYDPENRTATFTPTDPLTYSTVYIATVSVSIKGTNGARLEDDTEWDFGTMGDPGPEPAVTRVSIPEGDQSMTVGATARLTANVTALNGASQGVIWRSSKAGIASVDADGEVTALAGGAAVITATSDFDADRSASVTVTVTEPEPEPEPEPAVTNVTINSDDLILIEGGTATLEATVVAVGGAPTSVTWQSSDPTVATIDPTSGELTAVFAGNTTITAASTFPGGPSDSIEVTVNEPEPAVINVTIDSDDLTLYRHLGTRQITLAATVEAVGGASESVTWSSSDRRVASVNGAGRVRAERPGTATITATSAFDETQTDSITVTVRNNPF